MAFESKAIVLELPEHLTQKEAKEFLLKTKRLLDTDEPLLVFDLSQVRELGSAGVEMLLECLEQVIKRDGDLKLAAVPAAAAVMLELTCADRLFEIFATTADAVASFSAFAAEAARRRFEGSNGWAIEAEQRAPKSILEEE